MIAVVVLPALAWANTFVKIYREPVTRVQASAWIFENVPTGATPVREAINFPEGPLRAGAPRPDSSTNTFCLSCHHAEGRGNYGLYFACLDRWFGTEQHAYPARLEAFIERGTARVLVQEGGLA